MDKVLSSWPCGAKAAYICFLSNPQTLDITELIQDPAASPFACALREAKHVLAIPNNKVSIYTRAWCVYEAFLAYSWDKPISVAKTVKRTLTLQVLRVSFIFLASATGSVLMGSLVTHKITEYCTIPPLVLLVPLGVAYLFLYNRDYSRPVIIKLLVISIAVCCGLLLGFRLNTPSQIELMLLILCFLCTGAFEADRLDGHQATKQAVYLRRSFTGCLANAQCSKAEDKERIRAELAESGVEAEVEKAVAVLMHMNLSTPELRKTMLQTGTLSDATTFSAGFMIFGLCFFLIHPYTVWYDWGILKSSDGKEILPTQFLWCMLILGILEFLLMSLTLVRYALWRPDRWIFAVRMQALWWLVFPVEFLSSSDYPEVIARMLAVSIFLVGPSILSLGLLGPERVSRFPLLGAPLVRIIFSRPPWKRANKKPNQPPFTMAEGAGVPDPHPDIQ